MRLYARVVHGLNRKGRNGAQETLSTDGPLDAGRWNRWNPQGGHTLNKHRGPRSFCTVGLFGLFLVCFLVGITGCISGEKDGFPVEEGLMPVPTEDLDGTRIKFDPLASPMPEIPFPNDIATVMEPASPTGRRLNIRMHAPTLLEQDVRNNINGLDGFGTFSPITLSFEEPLDLRTVKAENIRLVNIDPGSKNYGEEIPMDLGPRARPGPAACGTSIRSAASRRRSVRPRKPGRR